MFLPVAIRTTHAEKHCLYLAAPGELPLVAPDEATSNTIHLHSIRAGNTSIRAGNTTNVVSPGHITGLAPAQSK